MDYATQALGRFIARLHIDDLPPSVVKKAKQCLMDAIGCLAGAHQTPFAHSVTQYAHAMRATGASPHATSEGGLDPATRAGCHAMMINALDYDDIFWKGHPGATVNSAVLAFAPILNSTGPNIIEAIVAGYEVSGRVAMSLGRSAPRKTVHGHGTWQTFGAAAAGAKLLGLDQIQTAHALAIAGANAPVPSVMKTVYGASPSMAKNNFASATHAGVCAAFLAQAGMEGPLDLFEGETGFWKMAGAEENDLHRLTRAMGEHYEITDVGFKAFSCCRIIQASAQAAQAAFDDLGARANLNDVEMIIAAVPEIACAPPFSDARPKTMWAAQFSVPYAIVSTLLKIEPGPDWFTPQALARATHHPLTDKILLRPRSATRYHGAEVSLMAGENRLGAASVKIAAGDAAAPLSETFLCDKFMRLATPILQTSGAQDAIRAIFDLECAPNPTALVSAIHRTLTY